MDAVWGGEEGVREGLEMGCCVCFEGEGEEF